MEKINFFTFYSPSLYAKKRLFLLVKLSFCSHIKIYVKKYILIRLAYFRYYKNFNFKIFHFLDFGDFVEKIKVAEICVFSSHI